MILTSGSFCVIGNCYDNQCIVTSFFCDIRQPLRVNTYFAKLIEDENGNEEFYNLFTDPKEEINLIGTLTTEQETIKNMLQQEAQTIRTDWSCIDGIKNGTETTIDDCNNTCGTTDTLSYNNIPCCGTPSNPSIY